MNQIPCLFRPLVDWPGSRGLRRNSERKRPTFITNFDRVRQHLQRELAHLGAREFIIELALDGADIRMDGMPRAGSSPRHPGCVVSFNSKHGPLRYPCDTYTEWVGNLRAVSLAMEALRAVDRYGVSSAGEQYRGWTALPAPDTNGEMGTAAAIDFLKQFYALNGAPNIDQFRAAYKCAALRLHPDVPGGDAEKFKRLQAAKRALEAARLL